MDRSTQSLPAATSGSSRSRLGLKARLCLIFAAMLAVMVAAALGIMISARAIDSAAQTRIDSANAALASMGESKLQMIVMSNAMRGALLDPSNEKEFADKQAADDVFHAAMKDLAGHLNGQTALLDELAAIDKFDDEQLNALEDHNLEMIKTDVSGARTYYASTYLPARDEEWRMVLALEQKVRDQAAAIKADLASARSEQFIISILALVALALGALFAVWRVSASISRPIVAVGDSLDKLARRDYATVSEGTDRSDEIGRMARSAESLRAALAEGDRMAAKVAAEQANREARAIALVSLST